MKTREKILSILCLLILGSCSSALDKTKASIDESKITINDLIYEFPTTEFNVKKTETIDESLGNLVITNWILEGADTNGPFMYFVAHNEVPVNLKNQIETDSNALDIAFKASLIGSATKLGGQNFKFKNIDYKGCKGMESICDVFNGDGIIKSRIYKIGKNLFVISAGGKHININSVNKFLDSFGIKQ